MSKQPPSTAASAAAAAPSPEVEQHPLSGLDIGKVMTSAGPIVKCVLLRARSDSDDEPANEAADEPAAASAATAAKEASAMSIKELKSELASSEVDASGFVEKGELISALEEARGKAGISINDNNDNDGAKVITQEEAAGEATTVETKKAAAVPFQRLISELEVDTTPRKSRVSQILGGPFTFLGQYEEEGIMVMIRKPDLENGNGGDNGDGWPVNPHPLQPPLNEVEVRGDILLMRVAPTEEELDIEKEEGEGEGNNNKNEGEDSAAAEASSKTAENETPRAISVPTNDDFFLDYTREEYLKFAARTDIVAKEPESDSSSDDEESEEEEEDEAEGGDAKPSATAALLGDPDEEEDDDDSSSDDDFDPAANNSDDDCDLESEEHQIGMMNMILSHMLRKFREENGRGPDSLELLEMRKALADRLGVEVPPVDEEACDWDRKSPASLKRRRKDGGGGGDDDDGGGEGGGSGGGRKKKVVAAEEMNETEEIPCRPEREDGEDDGSGDEEEDMARVSLKRPVENDNYDAPANGDEEEGNNKRAKMDDDANNGEEKEES